MRAHFARQCEVVAAPTNMVPTCEVFQVHGQPPPVSVECMSQSELFYGIPSMPYSVDGLWNLLHECTLHD